MDTINILREGGMTKSLLKLGFPVVVGMLIMAIYNVVGTFWVSGLGTTHVAAVSVAFPISLFFTGIALTFGIGGGAYISRLLGEKQLEKASQVASVSVITAFLTGFIASVICDLFLSPLLTFMGANEAIMGYAEGYAKLFVISCTIGTFNVASGNIAVSQGASNISALAMVTGALINVGLDPLFIYTFKLGIKGAAWAAIVCQTITSFIYIIYFRKAAVKITFKLFKPTVQIYKEVVKIGISMLFLQLMQTLSISLLQKATVKYGNEAVAAIGIVLKIVTLGTNVVFGFVKGFQPMAGYNYGAKNFRRLRTAIKTSLIITTSFCVLWSLLIFLFTTSVIGWFGEDKLMKSIAGKALKANTVMFFTFGFQFVYSTLYMAAGKARQSFLLNISRQGIFFIPVILVLPNLWGLNGVLYTQAVADIFTSILTLFFAVKFHYLLSEKNKEH